MQLRAWMIAFCCASAALAQPQTQPIKRPPNNQLALEVTETPATRSTEAPAAIRGIPAQLLFHVSPLSSKGLLSQQIEDAVKALDKANGNATILKLRAFVAGNGDLRRVQNVVNEIFTARKWPLPVVTTIQVGSLLQEGAQVVIESISEDRKPSIPGIRFVPAIEAPSGEAAIANLQTSLGADAPLRVTCFADSKAEGESARAAAAKLFPKAPGVFVQSTRYTLGTRVACEAVASSASNTPTLLFSGAQITFGESEPELRQAFERLEKLTAHPSAQAVHVNVYTTSRALAEKGRTMAAPSTTAVFIEGLPALDATLAVEAVTAAK